MRAVLIRLCSTFHRLKEILRNELAVVQERIVIETRTDVSHVLPVPADIWF